VDNRYDLIVIGSGPGGYVAAIKAAKLGMRTAIIERREIGGTCLNRGCIPTKTLMHSSHLYYETKHLQAAGLHVEGLNFNMEELQERKDEIILKVRQGIVSLLEANGVTIFPGTATIHKENQVIVKAIEGEQELFAKNVLVATGSIPSIPQIEGATLPNVMTSDELLSKTSLFPKLLIIGGGVIGVEFASIYSELGCEVEIIEAMDRILPTLDKEISQSVAMSLKKKGVTIHTKAKVLGLLSGGEEELVCEFEEKENKKKTVAAGILIAVGRKANSKELFAPEINVEYDGNNIKVNEFFETSIPNVYAIGDVIRGKQLAHAASAQGIAAVERMHGDEISIDLSVIPSCVYTTPEIAVVGMSEEEAILAGHRLKVGKYPMLGNCKTMISKGERGFIKVVADADTEKILGAQLMCERATDLVGEFSLAIVNGLTLGDLASVIRPHPTFGEAVTEAVEDAMGIAIHLMPKRK
jgi:dihydrolipoamide dehydrogenase